MIPGRGKLGEPDDMGRDSQRGEVVGTDLDEEAAGVPYAGGEDSVQEKGLVVAAEGA